MEVGALIDAVAQPSAFPFPVDAVEVVQTHISVVALAGPWVYKLKKPVRLGFLDFGTLELRRHFCEEEVGLNRRLAPSVYVGVVPLTDPSPRPPPLRGEGEPNPSSPPLRAGEGAGGRGRLRFEGDGEPVEYAVKMVRLPDDATLERRLQRGAVGADQLRALARKLADFHAHAAGGPHVSAFGRFDTVAGNARENFAQSAGHVGATVSAAVFERVRELTEAALARLRPLIEARAARGVPRDTHGDLHLDHVYLFPDRPPPDDLVVIDCIEFNERFRFADPVADMAFLVMDLRFHGRRDLAALFADAYFTASADPDGRALLPFYEAYRAVVRAKVDGMKAAEAEVPAGERAAAVDRARAHWLLALGELEEPGRRPCLVLAAGLPGSGKSTLARGLGDRGGFAVIRSDVVRKELAAGTAEDIYTPAWSERTYAECLRRADALLLDGGRVLVDANFRAERQRRLFLDLAARRGVPGVLLACRADAAVVRARLAARRGDASDADWDVYQQLRSEWEPPGEATLPALREIDANGSPEHTLAQALAALRQLGVLAPG
jgi:aminoglycoside phosphotransferase family enzyme/predicted kinase